MIPTVYVDRLAWPTCVSFVRALRAETGRGPARVRVLDPIPAGWRGAALLRWLTARGVQVTEAPFYAGHLLTPEGIPAQRIAAEQSTMAALPEAARVVNGHPLLRHLNTEWGRDTVRLHLAKAIAMTYDGERSLYGYALRVQVARALCAREGESGVLLLQQPMTFGADCLRAMAPEIRIVTYGELFTLLRGKAGAFKQLLRGLVRRARGAYANGAFNRRTVGELRNRAARRPGLLLLQEDDLAMDRSYRSQPHWLTREDPPPAFETYVVNMSATPRLRSDGAALDAAHVSSVSETDVLALAAGFRTEAGRRARAAARRCLAGALASRSAQATAGLTLLTRLCVTASELADAAGALRVRASMVGENYPVAADALLLVGEPLGIHTLSFQYSNMGTPSPLMMTTADAMCTFSPAYHSHWSAQGIAPRAFVDTGYPFDGAFALVRGRAAEAKARLRAAGAACIIGYFDENFFTGTKYGLTTFDEHCAELQALLELVLSDPGVGVVTKVQFQRNAASRLPSLQALVARAQATGRYLELVSGVHRNVVLPAEAALVADITIGHAIGGTAALEAALAGGRSVILNPYGMRDDNHARYARADILLPDLHRAIEAIAAFRRGDRRGLGDWSAIIHEFDAFHDGRAARRLRVALDALLADDAPAPGTPAVAAMLRRVVGEKGTLTHATHQ